MAVVERHKNPDQAIREWAEEVRTLRDEAPPPAPTMESGVAVGTPVPRLPLPDLKGGYASLDDFRGEERLVVFWSTECQFSRRMLSEFQEWDEEAGGRGPSLVHVVAGIEESVEELGLNGPILFDFGLASVSKAFDLPGTPSAIPVSAEGEVAGPMLVGADAILDYLWAQIEGGEDGEPVVVVTDGGSTDHPTR
jgi:peroxiredoxin